MASRYKVFAPTSDYYRSWLDLLRGMMEERPVDVAIALLLVLLVLGFLGFVSPSHVIPRLSSVHTPDLRPPAPHKVRLHHRAPHNEFASNEKRQKAVKAVLVLMLGFSPQGG